MHLNCVLYSFDMDHYPNILEDIIELDESFNHKLFYHLITDQDGQHIHHVNFQHDSTSYRRVYSL